MENNALTSLQYNNVYFRTYTFPFREFNSVMEDFHKRIDEAGIVRNGTFFYSLDAYKRKSDEDADLTVTIYQPAKEYKEVDEESLDFIDGIGYTGMSYRVLENNYDTQTERAYYELLNEAKEKGMVISGPFFHEFRVQIDSEGKKHAICIIKARMVKEVEDQKNG